MTVSDSVGLVPVSVPAAAGLAFWPRFFDGESNLRESPPAKGLELPSSTGEKGLALGEAASADLGVDLRNVPKRMGSETAERPNVTPA